MSPDGSAVYALTGDTSGSVNPAAPIPFTHDGPLWLHFNLIDGQALHWLAAADLQIPAQARQLFLSKDNYQQIHTPDDSVYGVISDLMRDIPRQPTKPAICALR